MFAYANRLDSVQPDGSTDFARLASVNLNIEASDVAKEQASPANTGGGGGNSAGGIFRGENSVFQLGAEFSPHFSRGGAEFSPCGILPV